MTLYYIIGYTQTELDLLPGAYRLAVQECRESVRELYEGCHEAVDILRGSGLGDIFTPEAFAWGFSHVRARIAQVEVEPSPFVASGDGPACALIPLFDLLNHHPNASSALRQAADGAWTVTSGDSYAKGAEVCINYGKRSNLELFMDYGFVADDGYGWIFFTHREVLLAFAHVHPGPLVISLHVPV